jgi:hypothetical protein
VACKDVNNLPVGRFFREARDFEGARRASRNAEIWIIVSIVAGIVSNALYVPLTLLMP